MALRSREETSEEKYDDKTEIKIRKGGKNRTRPSNFAYPTRLKGTVGVAVSHLDSRFDPARDLFVLPIIYSRIGVTDQNFCMRVGKDL